MALSISTVRRWALEYIGEAKTMVDQLRLAHPFQDLFRAWRRQEVPRTDDLEGGLHFDFHDSGCIFQSRKRTVDVNFGPHGRCDGFDAWRLFKYAKANYGEDAVPCLADFIEGIVELEKCGEVKKPGWNPGPHLFYFSSSLESQSSIQAGTPRGSMNPQDPRFRVGRTRSSYSSTDEDLDNALRSGERLPEVHGVCGTGYQDYCRAIFLLITVAGPFALFTPYLLAIHAARQNIPVECDYIAILIAAVIGSSGLFMLLRSFPEGRWSLCFLYVFLMFIGLFYYGFIFFGIVFDEWL